MYRGAKEGQQVWVESKSKWEIKRNPAIFVRYYKDREFLAHPNMAIVEMNGLMSGVSIKNIFKNDITD